MINEDVNDIISVSPFDVRQSQPGRGHQVIEIECVGIAAAVDDCLSLVLELNVREGVIEVHFRKESDVLQPVLNGDHVSTGRAVDMNFCTVLAIDKHVIVSRVHSAE